MKARWFEAFRRDPHQAVSDLFTGRAGVGAAMRLDVPELLQQWFPRNMADDRRCLDEALLWWLGETQHGYRNIVTRIGFPVYGKRVGDALIALQLLDLPQARAAIRADLAAWLRWLTPLRLGPERDPALECYGLLTHAQPDLGHMAMWLRLAADGRAEYLTVALAGIRRLPNDGDARQNQVLMLQALLRHAVVRFHEVNGAGHFFNRRFAAVRGLFPRTPSHWKGVLDDALRGLEHVESSTVAVELATNLRDRDVVKGTPAPSRRSRHLPVSDAVWRALDRDIVNSKQPADELAQRLFDILERNHEYALVAGDSYHFVRALSNLGSKLLVYHWPASTEMARFGAMIERALVWEPANPYCWTLWAKWFQSQGRKEAQEAILRETLRLFPRNAVAQVELARLLIARGEYCWAEAEHYLTRTIANDPDNGHACAVMARLLTLRKRRDDAEKMLAEFLERHPNNDGARAAISQLRTGTYTETDTDLEPNRGVTLEQGRGAAKAAPVALEEVLRRGDLTSEFSRARITGHVAEQTNLIRQECQRGDPLAGFYSQWLKLPDTPACPPPNAWAWEACLQWQKSFVAHEWEQLAKRFPEAASETRLLREFAAPASYDEAIPRHHHASGLQARPIDSIMHDGHEMLAAAYLDDRDRDEFACSLMACAAVNAPEFSPTKRQLLSG